MIKPKFYNLEITLNCSGCGKEVPFTDDPWERGPFSSFGLTDDIGNALTSCINDAWVMHQTRDDCHMPRRGEATINGKQYWITEKP